MENLSMRDELTGTTLITDLVHEEKEQKKNIGEEQMEFSTPIEQVLENVPSMTQEPKGPATTAYPFNLKKSQMEALVAGVAGVIGFSDIIQNKLVDIVPQILNDSGKLSGIGMLVMTLVVAIIFYFLKKVAMNR